MTTEMTPAEIARGFAQNRVDHEKFVTRELHDAVITGLREDMREVKATVNKLVWSIVGLAFAVVGAIIVEVAGRVGL